MKTKPENVETLGPTEFSYAITKVAVAQICQSAGFRGAQTYALETLTRIATIHLQTLAKSAAQGACSSGRTGSNLFDVVHALEHLSSEQGFAGASNLNGCLLASTPLRDLIKFVHSHREIPFAQPLPRRSKPSRSSPLPRNPWSLMQSPHIPAWLPTLPDPSTYTEPKIQFPTELNWNAEIEEDWKYSGNKEKKNTGSMELPTKRERMRFRMGENKCSRPGLTVGMKNGVCRGGKRISWQNHNFRSSKIQKQR